ncbi:MAG: c-type cytochrome [Acidobacteria bacterium]|nr:c-type cytochrome [Acidobacteriota bacterium]
MKTGIRTEERKLYESQTCLGGNVAAAGCDPDYCAAATASSGRIGAGQKVHVNQCALCHGIEGTGGKGPALNVPKLQRATNDTELAQVIRRGLPGSEMPGFWALSDREIQQLVSYVQSLGRTEQVNLPGDIARGQKLYETHCAACHIVRGNGGVAGPELTEIGLRRSPGYLREALLNPGASVSDGFLVVRVTTAQGQQIRGVRLNEDCSRCN